MIIRINFNIYLQDPTAICVRYNCITVFAISVPIVPRSLTCFAFPTCAGYWQDMQYRWYPEFAKRVSVARTYPILAT